MACNVHCEFTDFSTTGGSTIKLYHQQQNKCYPERCQIVLTETWFRDGLCGDIEGFTGYHMCRSEKAGGGVSIYVRNDHPSSFLDGCSSVDDSLEVCSVEVVPDSTNINNKIRIIGCFRPPKR